MKHFNGLSPAEGERLAMLIKECGEIIQAAGKVLRHGYESHQGDGGPSNRLSLCREIEDVQAVIAAMDWAGDVSPSPNTAGRWPQNYEGDHYDTIAASLITQWGEGLRGYQAANLQQAVANCIRNERSQQDEAIQCAAELIAAKDKEIARLREDREAERAGANDKLAKLAGLILDCEMGTPKGLMAKDYARYCLNRRDTDPLEDWQKQKRAALSGKEG